VSRLDLVVGPNGAGKSTFVRHVLTDLLPMSAFVNADVIAAQRWPDDPETHSYDAAEIADATRFRLIAMGRPFIAETVFSHPSKLDLITAAKAAEFDVALHVVMVPEHLSVARVRARVVAGGHDVPVDKIIARHRRLWDLVVEAVALVDTATFWDNSRYDGPQIVAVFGGGFISGAPAWPRWTPAALTDRWPAPER
jgi:predicted ABC-type ATPase